MRAGGEGEKVWDLGRAPKNKKINKSLTNEKKFSEMKKIASYSKKSSKIEKTSEENAL